jgi:NAD(P)-dependent dehydrogenase (short-subunit alcohol dehydrogenase family)
MLAATPIGRIGVPREIGDTAVFLASEEASFCTASESGLTSRGGFPETLIAFSVQWSLTVR